MSDPTTVTVATFNRGNCITLEQVNHYHRFKPGATQMRRPLCPMVIKKEVA